MKRIFHNKLVRDRIPDIVRENGGTPFSHEIRDDDVYHEELALKLIEEAKEVLEAQQKRNRESLLTEIADVQEVLGALMSAYGIGPSEVEMVRVKRNVQRGGFSKRILLEFVEEGKA